MQKYYTAELIDLYKCGIGGAPVGFSSGSELYCAVDADVAIAAKDERLQAGSAKLMADNAEYAKRHLQLNEENERLRRAVEWLKSHIEFEDDGEFGKIEVPAEFAEIIKPRQA
jgi:hypothetical protein